MAEKSEEVSQKTLDTLRNIRDLEKGLKKDRGAGDGDLQKRHNPLPQEVREKFGSTEVLSGGWIHWQKTLLKTLVCLWPQLRTKTLTSTSPATL